MAEPQTPQSVDEINLNRARFWTCSAAEIDAAFERLRNERPVSFHPVPTSGQPLGGHFWALARHADILEVSRDSSVWSSAPSAMIHDFSSGLAPFFRSMVNMDDPAHTRLRKIVSRGFTPAALGKLEHQVVRRATTLIDEVIEKGECDFVREIATPVPLLIICDMLGVPDSEEDFVTQHVDLMMVGPDSDHFPAGTDSLEVSISSAKALTALMDDLARDRMRVPQDDLISKLIRGDADGDKLSQEELSSFLILLLLACSDTTRTAISHGMKALCDHPDERRKWGADFEGIAPTAVEEMLRWSTPVRYFRRRATRDTEIGGQSIREGERAVLWYMSANRDERVFEDPYRFDVTRSPNEHVALGGPGSHYCLGASLAKREIRAVFRDAASPSLCV